MGGKNSKSKKSGGGKRKQNEISEDVGETTTSTTSSSTTTTSSLPSNVNAVQVIPSTSTTTSSEAARRDGTEPPASKRISIEVEMPEPRRPQAAVVSENKSTPDDKKEKEKEAPKEKEKEKQPEKKIDNKKSEEEDDDDGDYNNDSDDDEVPQAKVDLRTTTKIDKGKEKEIQSSGEWKSDNDEIEQEDDESQELDDDKNEDEEEVGWLEDNDDIATLGTKAQALTSSGIMEARANTVQEVCEFLCLEPHDAQVLLQHFKWDKNELLERYSSNPEKVCKDAGLKQHSTSNKPKVTSITCSICDEDVTEAQGFTALACDHYFCNSCWKENLGIQIRDGKSIEITCMHVGCSTLVPDYVVKKLVDEDQFSRYCSFASKSFVESSKMKWCPRPGCQNAVSEYATEGKCLVAKCTCGYKFCWQCNEEAHTPATCDLVVQWKKKCEDDSETYNWINSNTKPCPKCKVFIEKNDGCFQMTCRSCKHQWCWLCTEDWKSHGDHFSCNKYKGYKLQNKPQFLDGKATSDAHAALDRYLHYYNRYINHYNSLKFEDKTREKARDKMKQLLNQSHDNFYYNVNFIEEALSQLLDCRRTLKWTYVWAYYETDPLKKELFEFGQASLESITEKLSRMLEQPVEQISNTEIQHLTRVARQSLHNLFLSDRD